MTRALEPLRVPSASIEEGFARKVLWRDADGTTQEVVLCRLDGVLHATDSLCPHEGGRIAAGPLMQGRYLHCPLHLYRFDPASGEPVGVPCPPVRTFRVEEEAGVALVRVDEEP